MVRTWRSDFLCYWDFEGWRIRSYWIPSWTLKIDIINPVTASMYSVYWDMSRCWHRGSNFRTEYLSFFAIIIEYLDLNFPIHGKYKEWKVSKLMRIRGLVDGNQLDFNTSETKLQTWNKKTHWKIARRYCIRCSSTRCYGNVRAGCQAGWWREDKALRSEWR